LSIRPENPRASLDLGGQIQSSDHATGIEIRAKTHVTISPLLVRLALLVKFGKNQVHELLFEMIISESENGHYQNCFGL
jgi:hypothetical protein